MSVLTSITYREETFSFINKLDSWTLYLKPSNWYLVTNNNFF